MSLAPEWMTFLYATAGGLAINMVRWLEHAQIPRLQRPPTFSDPMYVAQFVILPIVGGFLAYIYSVSGTALSPLLAVNVGVSAPLILKTMGAAAPIRPPAPDRIG